MKSLLKFMESRYSCLELKIFIRTVNISMPTQLCANAFLVYEFKGHTIHKYLFIKHKCMQLIVEYNQ